MYQKYISKGSECKINAITSYYGGANNSTSLSATASLIASEIFWALKCTLEKWSGNSCENNILFTTMFPDSEVAKKFCMNKTKYSYVTNFYNTILSQKHIEFLRI